MINVKYLEVILDEKVNHGARHITAAQESYI